MDLQTIITCRTFCDSLRKMARIAREDWQESGLAVYSNPNKPRHKFDVSDVLVEEINNVRIEHAAFIAEPYSSISLAPLVYEDDYETVRNDLLLEMHSHPNHHGSDVWHSVKPSIQDLHLSHELSIGRRQLVSAVVAFDYSDRRTAHLLLYAASSALGVIPYFDQYVDEDPGRARTFEIMKSSNMPYAELTLNIRTRTITAEADLDEFVTKIA